MTEIRNVDSGRKPNIYEALFIIIMAVALILSAVKVFGADVHVPLVFSACVAAIVSMLVLKVKWPVLEEGILNTILMGMKSMLILYTVGMLIGVWIRSGVVPTMIYYGLDLLGPSVFLVATVLICSVVSLATGTSWGTSGTVGIALMGIGAGLGIPAPVSAGFVISGAYFGDKMSPLSDTTNLAPAMAGTDIFQHIRAMVWTTGPTYIIVLIVAGIMGMKYAGGTLETEKIAAIQALLSAEFNISLLGFLPPVIVIALAASGRPALPSIFAGVLAGAVLAMVGGVGFGGLLDALQNGYVPALSGELTSAGEDLAEVARVLSENGVASVTPEAAAGAGGVLKELLERGGLQSMNWTVSLILCALTFGGILDKVGYLEVLLDTCLRRVKSAGGLCAATIISCFLTNVLAGDQYISIVFPGRMMKEKFDESGMHPRMLSRSLEDSGTLTSVLIPWNTCGAYHWNTLGVHPLAYAPYAIMNWLNPVIAIVMTYMGIGIAWRTKGDGFVISKVRPRQAAGE
ncbi:MAG: Na+/H+ antiporter NhaC [Synergistaceae bacterium]|jgi:NhaC family Na+:H+ antiporter|nr:Na+/H+ antiporter NhaC [Synergistaceae bacterium]